MIRDRRNPRWIFMRIFFGLIFVAVISFVLMLLWNWLMTSLFALKAIEYWQAVGLLILSKILFSGVGMRPHHHPWKHDDALRKKLHAEFEKSWHEHLKDE